MLPTYQVLVQGGQYIPFTDVHSLGAVTFVFPDIVVAYHWRDRLRPQYPEIESIALGDAWVAMRKAADQALAGFQVETGRYGLADLFLFMVRAEEAGAALPTVLTHIIPPGTAKQSLTRTGLQQFEHDEILHWKRYSVLDRNPSYQRTGSPLPDWNQGDPFYEIVADNTVCTIADVPVLDSWLPTRGAVPFFPTEADAQKCWESNSFNNFLRFVPPPKGPQPTPGDVRRIRKGLRGGSVRIVPVHDLEHRLVQIREQLGEYGPLFAVAINPIWDRARMGWGSFDWGEEFAAAHDAKDTRFGNLLAANPGPWIRTITGLWHLAGNNRFVLIDPVSWWTGHDTFFWSGGQSDRLLPLRRSLVKEQSQSILDLESDALESEVQEIVEAYMAQEPDLDESAALTALPPNRLDWFVVVYRQIAPGEIRKVVFTPTDTVISAIREIVWFERRADRPWRVKGTIDELDHGFQGSHSEAKEDLAGEAFRRAMTRIAVRVVSRGYTPADANDIVALCNATLRINHVEFAGFIIDLLTASNEEQRDWLLNLLGFEPDFWDDWDDGTILPVDPHGLALLDCRLGESRSLLGARSLHFLASALALFDEIGLAPGIDYAPITIEIVKGLETELGVLFRAFKNDVAGASLEFNRNDRNQPALNAYLIGDKKLMLGNYLHLLKGTSGSRTELTERLQIFLSSLPNADFLLGDELISGVLPRVLKKYRNGGAHDAPVTYETCVECIHTLIGLPDDPGAISRVIAWKSGKTR